MIFYSATGEKLKNVLPGKSITYLGNFVYEGGLLKYILMDEGKLITEGSSAQYEYYLKDHLGNVRATFNEEGNTTQANSYYPFGMTFAQSGSSSNKYLYNGKELQEETDWLDYGWRMYDAAIGRWQCVDNKAELYFGRSPYIYALNTPINAIDPDGEIVIFINGNHFGYGAKGYKGYAGNSYGSALRGDYNFTGTRNYWATDNNGGGFDTDVMNHLGDHNAIYRDGAIGGFFGLLNAGALRSSIRMRHGYGQGKMDAEMIIASLARDDAGKIVESIKVISHSMGGAYAKGFIKAILEYAEANGIEGLLIAFEADFAPFQPSSQTAIKNEKMGPSLQFSHSKDKVAGNDPIDGAEQKDTSDDEGQGHSIFDFMNQIKNLPAGKYKVVDGKIVPVK